MVSSRQSKTWPDGTPKSLDNDFNWKQRGPSLMRPQTVSEKVAHAQVAAKAHGRLFANVGKWLQRKGDE